VAICVEPTISRKRIAARRRGRPECDIAASMQPA
jgi:hypothetical protein